METNTNFAAVVILYNPTSIESILNNISSYQHQVSYTIIIDNSDDGKDRTSYFSKNNSLYYKQLGSNKGIATALNIGLDMAAHLDCKWAYTFDQDSMAPQYLTETINNFLSTTDINPIGIIAPTIRWYNRQEISTRQETSKYKIVDQVITSGSCVNLQAYFHIKGFSEELFIDLVDTDFCFRLNLAGYKIIQLKTLFLKHNLGNHCKEYKYFGRHCYYITNHDPIRRYYMTRNALILSQKYKKTCARYSISLRKQFVKDFIKIILFENHKSLKLQAIYIAIKDAKKQISGKINSSYNFVRKYRNAITFPQKLN